MHLVMVAAYPAPGAAPVNGAVATTRLVSALGRCGVESRLSRPLPNVTKREPSSSGNVSGSSRSRPTADGRC